MARVEEHHDLILRLAVNIVKYQEQTEQSNANKLPARPPIAISQRNRNRATRLTSLPVQIQQTEGESSRTHQEASVDQHVTGDADGNQD